jgi:hypothetical protein
MPELASILAASRMKPINIMTEQERITSQEEHQ